MNSLQKFNTITTFVFDVDGVLTNGNLTILPNGIMARTMNVKDGYAIQLAIKKGFVVAIISGGNSKEVADRLRLLGVTDIYMAATNKVDALKDLIKKYDLDKSRILYMGDDLPDIGVMKIVGLPTCPQDAANEVIKLSKYISPISGGNGCVRDVIEKTMKLRNLWEHEDEVSSR